MATITQLRSETLISQVIDFTEQCRLAPDEWLFSSTPGGAETLYASAFACMLYHYTGKLETLTPGQKQAWAEYLNSWQDPESGYFLGPELAPEKMSGDKHSPEHVSQHLAAHVLPALNLLNASPAYSLSFAHAYTDLHFLQQWLDARDWSEAWLEGNNLLFVGQFLIYLRDIEGVSSASAALDLLFEWLDAEVDPETGLWGTNGYCSRPAALYGGYHQLLLYYYEDRPIRYPTRLIDVALSLQNADGSFDPHGRGSACQDTDAIDILVNIYKLIDYKRPQVRITLRRALEYVLYMQMPDGGFVNRRDEPFTHMGVEMTTSRANRSNLFPTWFRTHSLALIGEILTDEPIAQHRWNFNDTCSMGWHRSWRDSATELGRRERLEERLIQTAGSVKGRLRGASATFRRATGGLRDLG